MRGEDALKRALARIRRPKKGLLPPDSPWGQQIEARLHRLESRQKWAIGLSIATLAAVLGLRPQDIARIVTAWLTFL